LASLPLGHGIIAEVVQRRPNRHLRQFNLAASI